MMCVAIFNVNDRYGSFLSLSFFSFSSSLSSSFRNDFAAFCFFFVVVFECICIVDSLFFLFIINLFSGIITTLLSTTCQFAFLLFILKCDSFTKKKDFLTIQIDS